MKNEKLTPPRFDACDAWPDARGPAQPRPTPERAPGLWYLLSGPARDALCKAVGEAMEAHPDRRSRADAQFLGHRVREQLVQWAEAGAEAARSALVEIDSPAVAGALILTELALKYIDGGGELGMVRERIRVDQARAAQLERFEGPA